MRGPIPDSPRRVLLVGWDGADWDVIIPLMEGGGMPNLARLVEEGVMGSLTSLAPSLSPMLWTSIVTGKRPFRHGILGFAEPDPRSAGVRPVTNLSRQTRALWNILHLSGLTSNVVGWWPSHPAEPIRGVMVSNRFGKCQAREAARPLAPGTIHPSRLIDPLSDLQVHPDELEPGHIGPFLPRFGEIDPDEDHRPRSLGKILCECTSIHAAATALVQLEPWDFMGVYYDGIDHFSHAFMRYHPPRMEGIDPREFELYRRVVEGGYRFHDMMLGVLLGLAGDDVTVILVSDHGFHCGHLRPRTIPFEPAGPAVQHRSQGILVMKGPGVKTDEQVYGANLLDITPTILMLMGLPVGEDMDGKPLVNVLEGVPDVRTIPSWDTMAGEDGSHPTDLVLDPTEEHETLRQLVALGYIEEPDEDRERAASEAARELRYNETRSYMDAGRHRDAAAIVEPLVADWPEEHRFGVCLVRCYQALRRTSDARAALEALQRRRERCATQARAELKKRSEGDGEPEDHSPRETHELRRLHARANPDTFGFDMLLGSQCLLEDDPQAALVYFTNAELTNDDAVLAKVAKAQALLKAKQPSDAEVLCREAIAIDHENVPAQIRLTQALLKQRRPKEAADTALNAVMLGFHNPAAHELLGVALHRLGRIPRAVEALKVCVSQNPSHYLAHQRLAHIYERRLGNPAAAEEHRQLARDARTKLRALAAGELAIETREPRTSDQEPFPAFQDFAPTMDAPLAETTVVVSGLPRSGTSMMMQMLEAGGVPPLTDDARDADDHNRRGYYEYAPVKGLSSDSTWLPLAQGKAVKVVATLVPALPLDQGVHYRCVFMLRDLDEVLASQRDLLRDQRQVGARLSDQDLRRTFEVQLKRIGRFLAISRLPVVYVSHRECIEEPAGTAARITAFLGGGLNEKAMAAAVAPDLYQHRGEASSCATS